MKYHYLLKIIAIAVLSMSFYAHSAIDNAGVLDTVLQRYSSAASGWASVITNAATWLFWTLVLISMVWTFGLMALRKADIAEFFAEFIRFTIFTGFFWWLLLNGPDFANDIIQSLRQLAGNAAGLGSSLTPSGIVDIGFAISDKVFDRSSVWLLVDSAVGMIMALIILAMLAIIAINMLLLLVSGWVLAYGGVFFLGFGGARWTSDMAINYYKTVLGIAAQLMTMILLVGIGNTFLDDYYTNMTDGIRLKEMAVIFIAALTLLILTNKVPQMISGIITGASVGGTGVGSFGTGVILGAAGATAAATAMGGAMMAAGASNIAGGAQAVMAAASKASDNVSQGTDVMSKMMGGGFSSSGSSSSQSSGGSPLSSAMGFASQAGKLAADTGANLAKGGWDAAKEKAKSGIDSAKEKISDSIGGQIASAIKGEVGNTSSNTEASFDDNSLSADNDNNQNQASNNSTPANDP